MPKPFFTYSACFRVTILVCLTSSLLYCSKEKSYEIFQEPGFVNYFIPRGGSYSTDSTKIIPLNGINEMRIKFRFDSSGIYQTTDPANQADVNKLYGFADCVSFTTQYTIAPHHINSARFGWAWLNNAMRIYAYYYNDSVRSFKELQTVELGKIYTAGIRLVPNGYEFNIDNKKDTVPRSCGSAAISGYKLFPFFGGTEFAPKDIHIWIKEL